MNPSIPSDTIQQCPICSIGLMPSPRYPHYLCDSCVSQASDEDHRLLNFNNSHIGGGLVATYADTDAVRLSPACFIRGIPCTAQEAYLGSIVIQPNHKQSPKVINSWHVSVAAESLVASLFARIGYDVSVQYGANQPEYDLMISRDDLMAKVSVKGSKDGSWGLTQKYLKDAKYQDAIAMWEAAHSSKTVFALVQFKDVPLDQLPRVYVATPREIANQMEKTANGRGDTILYEHKEWTHRAYGRGTVDAIPSLWRFSEHRIEQIIAGIAYPKA